MCIFSRQIIGIRASRINETKVETAMDMTKSYAKRIRDLREDSDMNQQQIAEILETTQQQYSKYEKEIQEIPIRRMIKLAKIYDVSMDYICGLTDERRPFPKS